MLYCFRPGTEGFLHNGGVLVGESGGENGTRRLSTEETVQAGCLFVGSLTTVRLVFTPRPISLLVPLRTLHLLLSGINYLEVELNHFCSGKKVNMPRVLRYDVYTVRASWL